MNEELYRGIFDALFRGRLLLFQVYNKTSGAILKAFDAFPISLKEYSSRICHFLSTLVVVWPKGTGRISI